MRLRNLAIATAALGLIATPIVAQAANASFARDAAPVDEAEGLGGSGVLIGLFALAAVVGAVIIATESEGTPTSP